MPPPSADDEVIRSPNENKVLLQRKFLQALKQFKSLLRSTLVPKHSYNNAEFVTGEGEDFLIGSCDTTCLLLMRKLIFELKASSKSTLIVPRQR